MRLRSVAHLQLGAATMHPLATSLLPPLARLTGEVDTDLQGHLEISPHHPLAVRTATTIPGVLLPYPLDLNIESVMTRLHALDHLHPDLAVVALRQSLHPTAAEHTPTIMIQGVHL